VATLQSRKAINMTTAAVTTAPRDANRVHTEWLQWLPGERVAIRVASDITRGSYTVLEVEAGPRSGPPLHVHQNEDEHFIVLEGAVRIVCGERSEDVPAGMTLTVPRGVPHACANLSDAPARMLAIFSSGGIEGFFRQLPAVDRDGIETVAAAYGCRMVGAPLHA
jgi:mannose-6-phosphate isomerase-like protein (cupin superfamily)